MSYPRKENILATINSGASLSDRIDLGGASPCAIVMPSSWTTANLTFQGSADGETWADLYNADGSEIVVTAAASRCIALDLVAFAALRWLKIRSGTAATPVNQGSARTLPLLVRPV